MSQMILATIRAIKLVSRTGKKGTNWDQSLLLSMCVHKSFLLEITLSMNLEEANGAPGTKMKRPCMHTLDMFAQLSPHFD